MTDPAKESPAAEATACGAGAKTGIDAGNDTARIASEQAGARGEATQ